MYFQIAKPIPVNRSGLMAPMDAAKISDLVSNADSWAKVQLQFGCVRKQEATAYNIYKIIIREFEELYVIHI